MVAISSIDPNFAVPELDLPQDLQFIPVHSNPSLVFGTTYRDGCFRRMPEDIAADVSEGVHALHFHTAGGRVRFCTSSRRVAIAAKMNHVSRMSHFSFTGSIGFDLYEKVDGRQIFWGTAIPPLEFQDHLNYLWEFSSGDLHELTLHLPLYSGIDELYLGIERDAVISPAPDYSYSKPVVYYGSSITQGGCASRPGNAYPNQISLMLGCDHINLGFSGSAKAEDAMADYISKLDMSVFVYDYDHNAPDEDHLTATHEKMFQTIRSAQPDLPIIMLSMPRSKPGRMETQRRRLEIIRKTYQHALHSGDSHVYLIPGDELLGNCAEAATVDNSHPNDLGFYTMAQTLAPLIRHLL